MSQSDLFASQIKDDLEVFLGGPVILSIWSLDLRYPVTS